MVLIVGKQRDIIWSLFVYHIVVNRILREIRDLASEQEKIQLLLQQIFFLKAKNRFLLPAIVWLFISIVLLTLPGSAFPKKNWLDNLWFDKWVHIAMFGIMTVLFCWGLSRQKNVSKKLKEYFILIGILCLIYGISMEFVQKYWVLNRSFDMGDIIADGAGSIAGVMYSFKRYIKK